MNGILQKLANICLTKNVIIKCVCWRAAYFSCSPSFVERIQACVLLQLLLPCWVCDSNKGVKGTDPFSQSFKRTNICLVCGCAVDSFCGSQVLLWNFLYISPLSIEKKKPSKEFNTNKLINFHLTPTHSLLREYIFSNRIIIEVIRSFHGNFTSSNCSCTEYL